MIKRLVIFLLIPGIAFITADAQEVVTGLQSNYSVTSAIENNSKNSSSFSIEIIELPFFDDFSGQFVFPDIKKWSDSYVFINDTYSDRQITKGIATFDALNNRGRMYETAISTVFSADELTSQPINLEYQASDNIWLSFYYEPGGLGDSPEPDDSLTLQFLDPEENKWYSIWKAEGRAEPGFKQAMINVDNERFLKNGFQFRFINYATLGKSNPGEESMIGNCDHWNIDYVLLDKNRNAEDTVYADVAFRSPIRSLLKNHEAMPWNQFREIELQEMSSFIPIKYRNNDVIERNVTRNFLIWDLNKNAPPHLFTAGATDIDPHTSVDYKANLVYIFKTDSPDSAMFRITCSLKTDDFDPKGNDTIIYYQIFSNYFAFDDGSSEMGYGVNGSGSRNAMVAYRFVSFIPDTLRSIRICFNDSYLDANKRAFDLMVWDDDKGLPGNILYSDEEVMVEQANRINGFYVYGIPDGVPLDGTFYIGWKQRSETFLNAAFDVNTPHDGKLLYWLNGEWKQSEQTGSLMIRAVVGTPLKTTSIDDQYYRKEIPVLISPNPASDFIRIVSDKTGTTESSFITITDFNGRELIKCRLTELIDISSLHEGLYFVIISTKGRPTGYGRLIIAR